jgi:hypothetical protein
MKPLVFAIEGFNPQQEKNSADSLPLVLTNGIRIPPNRGL